MTHPMHVTKQAAVRDSSPPAHDAVTATQVAIPPTPQWFMRRERLLRLLDTSKRLPLVVVSAPAGSGKTTLVADWLCSRLRAESTVWVTAKAPDEPVAPLLWQALVRTGIAGGHDRGRRTLPERTTMAAVVDVLTAATRRVTVVLDGFELTSTAAADEVQALLDPGGDWLRVVLLSRVDPALALYRYRLSDSIVEIRAADLAFTPAETRGLFARAGLALSHDEVREILTRTGGWAVALRFSIRAVHRVSGDDSALAGLEVATTDINEYLLGEVLAAQPPDLRRFLLRTSVADTLHPSLVEELVGHPPVRTLEALVRRNAFIEPVEEDPRLLRYQPFFREFLRAQLAREMPESLADLRLRTGIWCARHGMVRAGLPHLVASRAWGQAAAAVAGSRAFVDLLIGGPKGPYAALLQAIPDDIDDTRCAAVRAALAWLSGDDEHCALELDQLRRRRPRAGGPSLDAVSRLLEALRSRDAEPPETALALAQRAKDRVEALDGYPADMLADLRTLVDSTEGIALLRAGDLPEARHTFTRCAERDSVHPSLRAEALGYLALTDAMVGRLAAAERNATVSLVLARSLPSWAAHPSVADLALGLVALDRYDLGVAAEHIGRSAMASQFEREPVFRALATIAGTRLLRSHGSLRLALSKARAGLLELDGHDRWLADHLHVEAARIMLSHRDAQGAHHELTAVTDHPEAELVAALAYLADGDEAAAADCLDGVPTKSASLSVTVARLLTEAACLAQQQAPARAQRKIDRGLQIAVREQLRRPFREAPSPVQQLLSHDPQLVATGRWVWHSSVPVTRHPRHERDVRHHQAATAPPGTPAELSAAPVVEQLTGKELEVLEHLAELLSTEEIAATMFVSINTVRTHVRSIMRKLRVHRRNAAVRRARELGLLGSEARRLPHRG